jgi:hypothetical protein
MNFIMSFVVAFSTWLKGTEMSRFVTHYAWVWPACETLHFIGLAMLVGVIGMLDLRMLGLAKGLPLAPLHKLVPWGVSGFIINVLTGSMFFAGDPFQYIHNYAFWLKMMFIAIAGLNMLAFYVTGVFRTAEALGPGEDAPMLAKVIAGSSLFLWVGVMYLGRMLPFLGNAF